MVAGRFSLGELFSCIAILLISAAVAAASPDSSAQVAALLSRAQEAQTAGDYSTAARCYQEVLKLRPGLAEAQANLGLIHQLMGNDDQAMSDFKAAIREKPDLLAPNLFLGLDLLKLHRPREALPYLKRTVQLNPADERAVRGLADAYGALGEIHGANALYARVVELNPRDPDALYGLGITYHLLQESAVKRLAEAGKTSLESQMLLAESFAQEGRVGDATRLDRRLLKGNPQSAGLRSDLGFAEISGGQLGEAKQEFETVLEMHAGFLLARLGLARVAALEGNSETCLKELQRIWNTDANFTRANLPSLWASADATQTAKVRESLDQWGPRIADPELKNLLAASLLGDAPSAVTALHQGPNDSTPAAAKTLYEGGNYTACERRLAREGDHLDSASCLLMAECAFYAGDYRESLHAAGKVGSSSPEWVRALFWQARDCEKLSLDALMGLGRVHANSCHAHLLLGEAFRDMENYEASEGEYQTCLSLEPSNPAAQLGLAATYWKQLKFDEALPHLQNVLAAEPQDTQANYMMGEILVERRNFAEARPYLVTALRRETGKEAQLTQALLAKVDAAEGRENAAIEELRQALPADDDGSLHFQLYQLYKKVGNLEAAKEALRQSEALRNQEEEKARSRIETILH